VVEDHKQTEVVRQALQGKVPLEAAVKTVVHIMVLAEVVAQVVSVEMAQQDQVGVMVERLILQVFLGLAQIMRVAVEVVVRPNRVLSLGALD